MKRNPWNTKQQMHLSDVFYDLEEEVFGDYVTPDTYW